jgi:ketosteroid isomerase-like protein
MTSTETGDRTERSGHVLTVFRKTPSGEWLLARDANLIAGK